MCCWCGMLPAAERLYDIAEMRKNNISAKIRPLTARIRHLCCNYFGFSDFMQHYFKNVACFFMLQKIYNMTFLFGRKSHAGAA